MKTGGKVCLWLTVVVVIVLSAVLVGISVKTVQSNYVALRYEKGASHLYQQIYEEGIHTGYPGFTFITFARHFISLDFPSLECRNKDGVSNTLDISFEYRIKVPDVYKIVTLFKDKDQYEELLKLAGSAAIHDACSLYNTSQFQAERGNFQETVSALVRDRFQSLYAELSNVQVKNIARPAAYDKAVQQKEAAKENIKVIQNERGHVLKLAETRLRKAEKQAEITVDRAESRVRNIRTRATSKAEAIIKEYAAEAETYEHQRTSVTPGEQLTDEGFLSYVGIRTIAGVKKPVYIGMKSPARTSYVEL